MGGSKQTQEKRVSNLSEAIYVLVQGCELGREKGIYDWGDLDLIGQSLSIVKAIEQQQLKESAEDNAPEVEKETAQVILDPKV